MRLKMQYPDGHTAYLTELSAADFEDWKKKIGNTVGVPQYWSEGLGVLPKPFSDKFLFEQEEDFLD